MRSFPPAHKCRQGLARPLVKDALFTPQTYHLPPPFRPRRLPLAGSRKAGLPSSCALIPLMRTPRSVGLWAPGETATPYHKNWPGGDAFGFFGHAKPKTLQKQIFNTLGFCEPWKLCRARASNILRGQDYAPVLTPGRRCPTTRKTMSMCAQA